MAVEFFYTTSAFPHLLSFFISESAEWNVHQGTFRIALWRGIQVAIKKLGEEVVSDDDKV